MKPATTPAALDSVKATQEPADTTAAEPTTTSAAPAESISSTEPVEVIAVSKNHQLEPVTITETDGSRKTYIFQTPALRDALLIISGELAALRAGKPYDAKRLVSLLYIVHHTSHPGSNSKLDGLDSISSCCLDNRLCSALRKIPGSICQKCYAATQQDRQAALTEHNIINGLILRNFIISSSHFRRLTFAPLADFIRIESFGDVANATQATNYTRIVKAFSRRHFGVWTKHPDLYALAFAAEGGKPRNLTFVVSSLMVNRPAGTLDAQTIDHTFTVYDAATIAAEGVDINCGGKHCADCIRARKGCYFKASAKNPVDIREQLKEDAETYNPQPISPTPYDPQPAPLTA